MIKRLAIIPARGGSKRIKNKNLKIFFGKPLIYYSILAAKKSKIFSKIHVSSDSSKILNYVKNLNVHTEFKRPKNLSNDFVGIHKVLKYVVKKYKKLNYNFDEIWLLYPTNPFINFSTIRECKRKFSNINSKPENSLITVTKYNYPVKWAQKINNRNILSPINKHSLKIRSQKIENTFCDAGMINVYSQKIFEKNLKRKYFAFQIPIFSSVDIDNYSDFELAKKLFKK